MTDAAGSKCDAKLEGKTANKEIDNGAFPISEDSMSETALRIERRGRVVILENQDPPRNRMTFEYMDELERARFERHLQACKTCQIPSPLAQARVMREARSAERPRPRRRDGQPIGAARGIASALFPAFASFRGPSNGSGRDRPQAFQPRRGRTDGLRWFVRPGARAVATLCQARLPAARFSSGAAPLVPKLKDGLVQTIAYFDNLLSDQALRASLNAD